TDAGTALGTFGNEVDEPPVVRAYAGEPMFVLVGLGRAREQHEAREERRHRVREQHLGDDTVALFLTPTHLRVPVARSPVVAEIFERVLVLASPRVEVVEILRFEILAVLR